MDTPFQKTPPKSAERIRTALESVRGAVARSAEAGPDQAGLAADRRVVIATFHQAEHARRFQADLLRAGIMSEGTFRRSESEIRVDHADCDRAAELLERHLRDFPDRPAAPWRRDFDLAIFGLFLGMTFGLIAVVGEVESFRQVMIVLVFTLFGAATGHCCDRPRNRYRRTGQLQFGIGDLLALTAVIALLFFIGRLISGR